MSKLADLIRRTTRAEARPLGFASAASAQAPSMLLIALVGERWAQGVAEAASAGADAFLLTGKPGDKDAAEAVANAGGRPCGASVSDPDAGRLGALREAGIDFVALDAQAPASALADEKLGFILHVRDDLTDIQLRTLEALRLDGLFLEAPAAPLTIARQMDLRRVSGLARKPLLLPVRHDIDQADLIALRDAGATLAGIDTKERGAADALRRLRGVIDGLPRPRAPKEQGEALLPRVSAAPEADEEDEGGEE